MEGQYGVELHHVSALRQVRELAQQIVATYGATVDVFFSPGPQLLVASDKVVRGSLHASEQRLGTLGVVVGASSTNGEIGDPFRWRVEASLEIGDQAPLQQL